MTSLNNKDNEDDYSSDKGISFEVPSLNQNLSEISCSTSKDCTTKDTEGINLNQVLKLPCFLF